MKTCNRCLLTKPYEQFYKRPRCKDGYANQCRKCEIAKQMEYQDRPEVRARRNKWARENRPRPPEQTRRQRLWTWHRIRPEDYDRILEAQGGVCAICKEPDAGQWGTFHVDHDHACCDSPKSCGKCVRGLLCARCNPMLGMARDNVDVLRSAVTYLDNAALSALGAIGG